MEFTGERYVPGIEGFDDLYTEHMSRYVFASRFLARGDALDVGCGCGYGAHYLARKEVGMVVGIDSSEEAIGFAQSRYELPNLQYLVADACDIELGQDFGLVVCFEVIEHMVDDHALLRQVSKVLAEDGVFLVSTPNSLNYVAGGQDGANPFHVREYARSEFRDVLRSVFPHVYVFDQYWAEGIIVARDLGSQPDGMTASIALPDDTGGAPKPPVSREPQYFIAACAKKDVLKARSPGMSPLIVCTHPVRYESLKRELGSLKSQFDERGAWALKLDIEACEKDKAIGTLQVEIADLRKQFDARGRWAQGLSKELETLRHVVAGLKSENENLRRACPAAGRTK